MVAPVEAETSVCWERPNGIYNHLFTVKRQALSVANHTNRFDSFGVRCAKANNSADALPENRLPGRLWRDALGYAHHF